MKFREVENQDNTENKNMNQDSRPGISQLKDLQEVTKQIFLTPKGLNILHLRRFINNYTE